MSKTIGIGSDLIEIARIRDSVNKHREHFTHKLFTQKELAYCQKYRDAAPHYAGRFAAKEAIVKAFGTGFGKEAHFLDIEILPDDKGKPVVHLSGKLKELFPNTELLISITHSKDYAIAFALLQES